MRALKITLVTLFSFLLVSGLMVFGLLRDSLPDLDGKISLGGLNDTVTIARDKHGVPHISASNDQDLSFALGYVHAQDRLWQMEMNRHIGRGRVAELVGKPGLSIDRVIRAYGFSHRAKAAFETLPENTKQVLTDYAAGVNAFLDNNKNALPPEYLILGAMPEPWKPQDTLIWQKLMWLDLSGNMGREVSRAKLLTKLSPEQVTSLYPTYPGEKESVLPDLRQILAKLPLSEFSEVIAPEKPAGYGSNNWVVSGDHTESRKPLLANDPHLGLTTPSIWYLVRLYNKTTNNNLVGVSFPGSPSIILGRNDNIAWGFTNTYPDTQDLFIEKLVGSDMYLTPTGPKPFKIRREVIKVKGSDDIIFNVRETRHGPVMSDALQSLNGAFSSEYVLALKWTALADSDTAVAGILGISHANNFQEFRQKSKLYSGPEQNMIYADTDGNIGLYAPGVVPIRHKDNQINGRLPSPGWLDIYDWQDYIPFEELPTRLNPESGMIVTANERIVPLDYPHFITRDWALPYRSNRITDQLRSAVPLTPEKFADLHQDTVSDVARDILPHLLSILGEDHTGFQLLKNWDGNMAVDRHEPLVFQAWLQNYYELLVRDELDDLYDSNARPRIRLVKSSLFWSLNTPKNEFTYYALPPLDRDISLSWCDTITTVETETCPTLATKAMNSVLAALDVQYGTDYEDWRWGDAHRLTQTHRPFSNIPVLSSLFSLSGEQSGGRYTVNVAGVSRPRQSSTQFSSSFGPSYRGIFDLNDLDKSLYIQPTGQSGHFLSKHFGDLYPKWQKGDYIQIPTKQGTKPDAVHILILNPDGDSHDGSGK